MVASNKLAEAFASLFVFFLLVGVLYEEVSTGRTESLKDTSSGITASVARRLEAPLGSVVTDAQVLGTKSCPNLTGMSLKLCEKVDAETKKNEEELGLKGMLDKFNKHFNKDLKDLNASKRLPPPAHFATFAGAKQSAAVSGAINGSSWQSAAVPGAINGNSAPTTARPFWDYFQEMDHQPEDQWKGAAGSSLSSFVFMLICACIYKSTVVDSDAVRNSPLSFKFPTQQAEELWDSIGLCGCFSSPSTCCYVCCMAPVVTAKNYDKTGVLDFWPACVIVSCTYQFPCIGACVRTYFTGELKSKYQIPSDVCTDFFINLCCYPCEVGRESIFVDLDMGVEIGCPFTVEAKRPISTEVGSEVVSARSNLSAASDLSWFSPRAGFS